MGCINHRLSMINGIDNRFVLPGTKPYYGPDKEFKTEHIKLEFSFDMNKRIVYAKSETHIRAIKDLDLLTFDAVNMKIQSVYIIEGKKRKVKYRYDGEKLNILPGKKMKLGMHCIVSINYRLVDPTIGVYFIKRKDMQVWTHAEAEDARYWFPCYDSPNEKATTEMILNVPKDFVGLSNGRLMGIREIGNKRIFHWKMSHPHSTYLVMFAVGKFSVVEDKWQDVPVLYYCEKGREEDIKRAFGKTPKMIDFFSKKTGIKYPYEKYAQVAVWDFVYGGMEHTTITTQTDTVLFDKRAENEGPYVSDSLAAHELAHQWFGDLVTCKNWSDAWLNESFATYFDALFVEYDLGYDEFNYEMYRNLLSYIDEDTLRYRRPIVTNMFKYPSDIFDRHLYQKGSLILHMLRCQLGDELWWKVLNHYLKKFSHRTAETTDFITCVEEISGKNMRKFFDQWIYKEGHPELKAIYSWNGKELSIRISQEQKNDLFSFPLEIEVTTRHGKQLFKEKIDGKQHLFKYKLKSKPVMIRIDPEWKILKKMDFHRSLDMLIHQLKNDGNPLGRIDAAIELGKNGSLNATEALSLCLLKEKFWGVQSTIARTLGLIRSEQAYNSLIKGLQIKNVFAKRTVIEALGEFKDKRTVEILNKELRTKEGYFIPSECLRSLGKTKDPEAFDIIKKNIKEKSWADLMQLGVVDGMFFLNNEKAINVLKEMTTTNYPQRIRMAAIRNLGKMSTGRKDVFDLLIKLSDDRDSIVQNGVAIAFGDMMDERAVPVLEKMTKGHRDTRIKRIAEESIRKIHTWIDTDIDMHKLKQENEELKKKLKS